MKTQTEGTPTLEQSRHYLAGLLFSPVRVADHALDIASTSYLNIYVRANVETLRSKGTFAGVSSELFDELCQIAGNITGPKGRRRMRPDQSHVHEMTAAYLTDEYASAQSRIGVSSIGRVATLVLASHIDAWRFNPNCIPSEVPMLGYETDPDVFYDMVGTVAPRD